MTKLEKEIRKQYKTPYNFSKTFGLSQSGVLKGCKLGAISMQVGKLKPMADHLGKTIDELID